MKTVYLIRHAKSSWSSSAKSDFDRPLNDRGKLDAVTMGNRLKARNEKPDLVYCSTAKRARKTCKKITKQLGLSTSEIHFDENLYHASYRTILNVINETDAQINSIFIIGHNPGLSMLASVLIDDYIEMATCSIVKMTFDCNDWDEVFNDTGELAYHDYPKINA